MAEFFPELTSCRICPRNCGVDRYQTTGFCQAPADLKINLHQLHHGEEPVLSGTQGSGTIFFSHCNLKCVFCQNYEISELGYGELTSPERCLEMMLELQQQGAHNINLVTPSHYSIQLEAVLRKARANGLTIPIVWNSNAYEKVEILKRLDGLIDIYLPDLKYANPDNSSKYSHAMDYPVVARQTILEMHRQVGQLTLDNNGIAERGIIIRLLVLPQNIAGVTESLQWIHANLGNEVFISLMAQYYPVWQADRHPEINQGISQKEYDTVLETLDGLGFTNGFVQDLSCSDAWTPDFKHTEGI